jgi:replicative DNA helicase
MQSFDHLNEIIPELDDAHFSTAENKITYNAIKSLYMQGLEVNLEMVLHQLNQDKKRIDASYLIALYEESSYIDPTNEVITLQNKKILRSILNTSSEFVTKSCEPGATADSLLEDYQSKISQISKPKDLRSYSISDVLEGKATEEGKPVLDIIKLNQERKKKGQIVLPGMSTGWNGLDDLIGGLVKNHLIIVGANPGAGKSTFCINMIRFLAIQHSTPVAFFSLEMSAEAVAKKMLSMQSGVSFDSMEKGTLSEFDFYNYVVPAEKELQGKPFYIEDQQNMPLIALKARAARLKELYDIKAIFIDYLGYITTSAFKDNRVQAVSYIAAELKGMAKFLNVPVICISQLSRDSTKANREPNMADLRDSGQIEANADEIILLHRPDQDKQFDHPGEILIKVDKNRFGPKGRLKGAFDGPTGKITNVMTEQDLRREIAKEIQNRNNHAFSDYDAK